MSKFVYTNWTWPDLRDFNYQIHDDLQRDVKRKMFDAYKRGLEDESHWNHKWDGLPSIGKYRRIKKFLIWYNKYI